MKIKKIIITLIGLILLQLIIDLFFVFIYPNVNPIRATMIGITSLVFLSLLYLINKKLVNPVIGALSIFYSAFFGALLVQSGYLISKSSLSGLVHALILIITYLIMYFLYERLKLRKSR
ncbi:hypothetical protein HYU23_02535 [Candidatus Woesearchaeota archaeon]|nr:hypothetical protein [Candidatus Woesearchaeota archaeon]